MALPVTSPSMKYAYTVLSPQESVLVSKSEACTNRLRIISSVIFSPLSEYAQKRWGYVDKNCIFNKIMI